MGFFMPILEVIYVFTVLGILEVLRVLWEIEILEC
jgi:hypothetical protein